MMSRALKRLISNSNNINVPPITAPSSKRSNLNGKAVDDDDFSKGREVERSDPTAAAEWYIKGIGKCDQRCNKALIKLMQFNRSVYGADNHSNEMRMLKERAKSDPNVCYLLGLMLGRVSRDCDAKLDREAARYYLDLGAKAGHGFCVYLGADNTRMIHRVAHISDDIIKQNYSASIMLASDLDVPPALFKTASNLIHEKEYHKAAVLLLRGLSSVLCVSGLKHLFETKRMEVSPFGVWSPSLHCLVHDDIHHAVKCWLLIARRTGLCKDVTQLILKYIVTRDSDRSSACSKVSWGTCE